MKRLIITGPRQAVFEEVPAPECPVDGLLVRATVTAISAGTEVRVFRAEPVDEAGEFLHEQVPFELPTENGYSMVGEVTAVGQETSGFHIGDRVFVPAAHKEIAAVPAKLATKLPAGIPDEQAVFLSILEVAHIAVRRGRPSPGENVAIIGQGVIGLAATAWCRAFGFRIVVVDPDEIRLKISRAMGADLAVSPNEQGFLQNVIDFCGGEEADLVLEAASNWSAIRTSMELARIGGRIVVVARHTDQPRFNPVGHPFFGKQLELITSYGHQPDGERWDRRRSFALAVDLLRRQRLDIAPMITHRFERDELPDVYARLDRGERAIIGAVIDW